MYVPLQYHHLMTTLLQVTARVVGDTSLLHSHSVSETVRFAPRNRFVGWFLVGSVRCCRLYKEPDPYCLKEVLRTDFLIRKRVDDFRAEFAKEASKDPAFETLS